MKLHYILFALAVIVGIIAVICTYLYGILPRHEHYQQLLSQEEELRQRIEELDKKFSGTQPAVVVAEWEDKVPSWAQAVSSRISYFDTLVDDDSTTVVVPEEERQFPKFWYQRERQRRIEAVQNETVNANLVVASTALAAYEPPLPGGPGWDPTAETVEGWLSRYERAASFVREMIEANAREIVTFQVWPSQVVIPAPEGTVHLERVGYEIIISMEDFADYLAHIHSSDTYMSIAGLSLAKEGAPSDPDAPLRASFILDRTRFVPAETSTGEDEASPALRRRAVNTNTSELTKALTTNTANIQFSEEELARIRAATAEQNPSFFRGILRWFGI